MNDFRSSNNKGSSVKVGSNDGPVQALWRLPEWFPDLDPRVMEALRLYHAELIRFNVKLNLISRNTEREADEVHFADSIFATRMIGKAGMAPKVYDVGSGNGLPGVVMALFYPTSEFFLIESDARKCEFLKHMIHLLKISNCKVMNMRLEAIQTQELPFAVSRGFAAVAKTLLMVNRSFVKGGKFYHLKGGNWSTEVAQLPSQLISVWKPQLVGEYTLPGSQARRAVLCTTKL